MTSDVRPAARADRRTPPRRHIATVVALAGLTILIAGTFLPWLVSGEVRRNSYEIVGVINRLGLLASGPGSVLAAVWPFLGPTCILPVLAGLLRWWRTAGVLCVLLGVTCAVLAGMALVLAVGRSAAGVSLDPVGPVTVLLGSVIAITGGALLVARAP